MEPVTSASSPNISATIRTIVKLLVRFPSSHRASSRPIHGKTRMPTKPATAKKTTALPTVNATPVQAPPPSSCEESARIAAKVMSASVSAKTAPTSRTLAMRVPSRLRSMRIRDLVAREVTPIAMPMKRAAGVE